MTKPDDRSRCSSCYQPVLWVSTLRGAPMPVDPDPVPNGNIELLPPIMGSRQLARVHSKPLPGGGYVTHFLSCPYADKFRKKGR